jgi:hypothetical protein
LAREAEVIGAGVAVVAGIGLVAYFTSPCRNAQPLSGVAPSEQAAILAIQNSINYWTQCKKATYTGS